MYKILSINYQNGGQIEHEKICYLDRATENCELLALKYVVGKEGEKYLNKPFRNKLRLPVGYSVVKKNTEFYSKYTIYHRERDGYIYAGKTVKVIKFFTFKCSPVPAQLRVSEMSEDYKDRFSFILIDLPQCDEMPELEEN